MKTRNTLIGTVVSSLILISVLVHPHTFGKVNAVVQPATGYVTGRVMSSGSPVPAVWVIISQRGGSERGRSLTGDDGRYYIDNLDDGAYDLLATKGNRQVIIPIDLPSQRVVNIDNF